MKIKYMFEGILGSLIATFIFEGSSSLLNYIQSNKKFEEYLQNAFDRAIDKWAKNKGAVNVESKNYNEYKKILLPLLIEGYAPNKFTGQKSLLEYFVKEVTTNVNTWNQIQCLWNQNQAIKTNEIIVTLNSLIQKENQLEQSVNKIYQQINFIQNKLGISDFEIDQFYSDDFIPTLTHISKRKDAVSLLINELKTHKWLYIVGSILSGKRELIKLICEQIHKKVIQIDIEKNTDFLKKIITSLHTEFQCKNLDEIKQQLEDQTLILVINHFPRLTSTDQNAFSFFKKLLECNLILLSSSYYDLPIFFKNEFEGQCKVIQQPFLSEQETIETISTYIKDHELIYKYSKLVWGISNGHPAIINVLCSYLHEKGWNVELEEFAPLFHYNYSPDFSFEVKNLLINSVPDEQARELLYRLQIPFEQFNDEIIKIVGNVNPSINHINEKFISLIGLWIQRLNSDAYKLSPLLNFLQKNTDLSPAVFKRINFTLGKKILKQKTLNEKDIRCAILYFSKCDAFDYCGFLMMRFLETTIEYPDLYEKSLLSKYWIDIPLPHHMPESIKMGIRALQIINCQKYKQNSSYLLKDLENIVNGLSKSGINISYIYSFMAMIFSTEEQNDKAFSYLTKANKLIKEFDISLFPENEKITTAYEDVIWIILNKIRKKKDALLWFENLQQIQIDDRQNLLSSSLAIESPYLLTTFLTESIGENKSKCDEILEILEILLERGKNENFLLIAMNALNKILLINGVIINKPIKALEIYHNEVSYFKNDTTSSTVLLCTITKILYDANNKEYSTFIPLLEEKLKNIEPDLYLEKLEGLLILIQHYYKQQDKKAINYALKAYEYVINNENIQQHSQIRIIGIYAWILWGYGEKEKALEELSKGYALLLDSFEIDDNYRSLILKFGILIRFIAYEILNKEIEAEQATPSIQIFLTNSNNEKLLELYNPLRDYMNSYMLLDSLENLQRYDLASEWSIKLYNMSNKISINPYLPALISIVPYFSKSKHYSEIIDLYDLINEYKRKVINHEIDLNEIIQNMNSLVDSHKFSSSHIIEESEDIFIICYLLPIIIDILFLYIQNKDKALDEFKKLYQLIKKFLLKHSQFSTVQFIADVIELFSVQKGIIDIADYNKPQESPLITLIVYLLYSLEQDAKNALKTHLALIVALDHNLIMFKSCQQILLYPFFYNYWILKISEPACNLDNLAFLRNQGVKTINKGKGNDLKRLFRVLSNHIEYQFNEQQECWITD